MVGGQITVTASRSDFQLNNYRRIQPLAVLSSPEKILKAPLRDAFKIFSEFSVSAKRCMQDSQRT